MNNKFLSISLLSLLSISISACQPSAEEFESMKEQLAMARVNARKSMLNGHVRPQQRLLSQLNTDPVAAKMIGEAVVNAVVTKVVDVVCNAVEKAITQEPASTPSPYVPTTPPTPPANKK